MKIKSFKNKFGHIKLYRRKKYWLFGDKLYYVSGWNKYHHCNRRHNTFVHYTDRYTADETYEIIKSTIIMEARR